MRAIFVVGDALLFDVEHGLQVQAIGCRAPDDPRPSLRTATYRALYTVGARWELERDTGATRLIWYPWPGHQEDVGYRAAMDFAVADMANAIRRASVSASEVAYLVGFSEPRAFFKAFKRWTGMTPREHQYGAQA